MNILLVSGPGISLKEPYSSGIESFMVSLANQLVSLGHTVDIIAQDADPTARFTVIDPFIASRGIRNDFLRQKKEQQEFRTIDAQKYDVIHYNMLYPHLYRAGAAFGKPSVLTLHSPKGSRRVRAYKKLARDSNVTFASISERNKDVWDKALGTDSRLIHNGIDLSLWPLKPRATGGYLIWSARINHEKNVAAAIKLANHLHLPLKIAGRIVDQSYFNTQVAPYLNDTIEYVGHLKQAELSKLAQNASAYLATATWQEPFGLAALEMLASGVKVVGFETAVPPDWCTDNVSVVPSADWHDLITPLQQSLAVAGDPTSCRAFASSMSVRRMAQDYSDLYHAITLEEPVKAIEYVPVMVETAGPVA